MVQDDEAVIAAWLERRRALVQDRRDEVWEGDHHVAAHEHARSDLLGLDADRVASDVDWP